MKTILVLILLVFLPGTMLAQLPSPPSDSVLAAISERGRQLAAYDRAAWHGTDALIALGHDLREINVMLARPQEDGAWIVHFGRLSADQDSLYQLYEAVGSQADSSYTAQVVTPSRILPEPELRAARALHRALSDFGRPTRPYNSYVLSRRDGGFWVYLLPARTDARVFPHGADVRYHVAENGRDIIERHQMHVSMVNTAAPSNAVSGAHTVVTEDLPQDSDVFLVLTRFPRLPEMVVTESYIYQIGTDGSISYRPKQQ